MIKLEEALDVAVQVASALAAAHKAGIIHRDIKPENIMIRHDGFVKVLDFGLVKLTEKGAIESGASTLVISTDAGVVMGTAHYMSPEQARGLVVDTRTDIWSLGVVLYEMVAGRTPFEGGTPSDVLSLILQREPAPLCALLAGSSYRTIAADKAATETSSTRRSPNRSQYRVRLATMRSTTRFAP